MRKTTDRPAFEKRRRLGRRSYVKPVRPRTESERKQRQIAMASLQAMAYLGLADDGLQVRGGLQVVGVRAAHERFDGSVADGPAEEQFDHSGFGHGPDQRQHSGQLVVPDVGPGKVHMPHVPSECLPALDRQPVEYAVLGPETVVGSLLSAPARSYVKTRLSFY